MRRIPGLLVILLLVSPLSAQRRQTGPGSPTLLRIGALFSLTGDGASLGNASAVALDLAARDINAEMQALNLPYHVEADVEDTGLIPEQAQAKLAAMSLAGIGYVIGPQTSAEAAAVLDYANAHQVVVVSQGSTASSLAIPDDYLFRLAPNDKLEGAAMASLMREDGIDTIVPIWRNDPGNIGLRTSTKRSFEALGGTVDAGVPYEPTTSTFATQVSALSAAVRAIKSARPTAKIAIYLASFEEGVDILDRARVDPDLSTLRWYGGDGVVQSQAFLANASVASFASTAQFTAPNVGLDDAMSDVWQPISDEIKARVGFAPDAYSLSVYDAAWVIALSYLETRGGVETRREAFVRNVQRYSGLTGSTALDANGDRKSGDFDFWTIQNGAWVRTGQYAGGHISR